MTWKCMERSPNRGRSKTAAITLKNLWFLLEKNLYGHPCRIAMGENSSRNFYVKMDGRKHDLEPKWKILLKHIDLEKPTEFRDQVYLGCTQRESKPNNNLVDDCSKTTRSIDFRRCFWQVACLWERGRKYHRVVPQHGRTRKAMRKTVLRICKRTHRVVVWCLHTLYRLITSSRKRSWKQWENCQKFALNSP